MEVRRNFPQCRLFHHCVLKAFYSIPLKHMWHCQRQESGPDCIIFPKAFPWTTCISLSLASIQHGKMPAHILIPQLLSSFCMGLRDLQMDCRGLGRQTGKPLLIDLPKVTHSRRVTHKAQTGLTASLGPYTLNYSPSLSSSS